MSSDDRRLEAARLRQLHRLDLRDRGLRAVIAVPYLLLCPTAASIAHYVPPRSGVWQSIGLSLALPAVAVLYGFALVMWEWSSWSHAYRHYPQGAPAIDWADARWHPVRDALAAAGYDPQAISAVRVFRRDGNLLTVHRPRFSPGRLGAVSARAAAFAARRRWYLIGGGASIGVIIDVLDTETPGWRDVHGTPPAALVAVMALVLVLVVAVGAANATGQVRLNLLRPHSVVQIPSRWTAALAENPPGARVSFLHEMSHARHGDMSVRRITARAAALGVIAGWLDASSATLAALPGPTPAVLFVLTATSMTMCVRRSARLLRTIQELRADADACLDAASMREMGDLVEEAQRGTPSSAQAARLYALRHAWADPISAGYRTIVTAMGFGGVLPVLIPTILIWTGAVPVTNLSTA